MPTNKDIKELMAARKARRAIPQTDPADVAVRLPEPELVEPPTVVPAARQPELTAATGAAPPVPTAPGAALAQPPPFRRRATLTPFSPTESVRSVGFHMYPSRHEQLRDIAYIEQRKPWEIIETAMADYIERHYGDQTQQDARDDA